MATASQSPRAGSFVGDATLAVLSSVGARLVALAAMAVITRLYAAQSYGIWVLVLAFSGLFIPFTTLRYEIALVLAPGRPLARRLLWAMLLCTLLTAMFLVLGLSVPSVAWLAKFSGLPPEHAGWLFAAPLPLALMAWQVILQSWLTREKRFLAINLGAMLQVLVAAGVTLLGGWLIEPLPAFAVAGGIAGQFAVVLMLAVVSRASLCRLLARRPTFASIGRAMRLYRVYPQYVLPYSISVGLTERSTQVALSAMYSVSTLGAYYAVRQIVLAPAQIVSASLRNVLLAYGARHGSLNETRPYVLGLVTAFCLVAAPVLALGVVWIERAVTLILGNRWPQMGSMAWWCLFPGVILMLTGSVDRLFDLASRQRLATGLQVLSDLAMIIVLLLAWRLELPGLSLVAGLSVTQAVYNLLWLVVLLRISGVAWRFVFSRAALFCGLFAPSLAVQFLIESRFAPPTAAAIALAVALVSAGSAMALFLHRFRAAAGKAGAGVAGAEPEPPAHTK